jgi:hypothetical protein
MTETTRLYDGTQQGLFDTVVAHLFTQGRPALVTGDDDSDRSTGDCLYRGPNGTKCAIGCLIPDDRYSESLEDLEACNVQVMEAVGAPDGHGSLMKDLQRVHDSTTILHDDGTFNAAIPAA